MKNLFIITAMAVVVILTACNNPDANNLTGKWKNLKEKNTGIEFTATGVYHLWINGTCVTDTLIKGSPLFKYSYDPSAMDYNLKIADQTDKDQSMVGNIVFINPDRIKVSTFILTHVPVAECEFARVKNFSLGK